jgi:hypothetical protein
MNDKKLKKVARRARNNARKANRPSTWIPEEFGTFQKIRKPANSI